MTRIISARMYTSVPTAAAASVSHRCNLQYEDIWSGHFIVSLIMSVALAAAASGTVGLLAGAVMLMMMKSSLH